MRISEEELLRIIEFRVCTVPYKGTLCKVIYPIDNAEEYFKIYSYNGFITNPYTTLSKGMYLQMTHSLFNIFVVMVNRAHPVFTDDEILYIEEVHRRYSRGKMTVHNNIITFGA